jgi:hypothetical protein
MKLADFNILFDKAERRDNAAARRRETLGKPSIELMARTLAGSGADLKNEAAIVDAFVARGIRPTDAADQWHQIVALAGDMREGRL